MEPPDDYCLSSDRFADQGIEIVPGEKSNSEWLVLNDLYILHKNRSFKNGNVVWECKHRRGMGCPFRMETGISNEDVHINQRSISVPKIRARYTSTNSRTK